MHDSYTKARARLDDLSRKSDDLRRHIKTFKEAALKTIALDAPVDVEQVKAFHAALTDHHTTVQLLLYNLEAIIRDAKKAD
jgi:hypothetical protein